MRTFYLIIVTLLIALTLQCLYFAWDNGQVVDETFYNGSGYPMVRYNDYRFLGEHPPLIMQLASLPLLIFQPNFPIQEAIRLSDPSLFNLSATGSLFLYQMGNSPYKILFIERCVIIMITLILGITLVVWSYELFGQFGAIISLVLYAFCPNIISHGSIFTTDIGISAFFFLTIHRLNKFFKFPTAQNLLLGGIFAGFALMSKVSGLVLFPILICLFAAVFFFRNDAFQPTLMNQKFDRVLPYLALSVLIFSLTEKIAAAVLLPLSLLTFVCTWKTNHNIRQRNHREWMSIIFFGCWTLSYTMIALISLKRHWLLVAGMLIWNTIALIFSVVILRKSKVTKSLAYFIHLIKAFAFLWFIAAIIIILGYTDFLRSLAHLNPFHHYIRTFNIAFSHTLSEHRSCLPGSFVTCDWRYFLTTMAIKTPVITLAAFSIGLPFFLLNKQLSKLNKIFVVLPPLFFLLVASFLSHINIGLRHVLPVYPFLFLVCGNIGPWLTSVSSTLQKKSLFLALFLTLLWYAYSTASVLPHSLSYFNEFIPSIEKASQITSDSNLSWGQDNKRLALFLKKQGITSFAGAMRFSNPDEYGYHHIAWRPMTEVEFTHPKAGFYAVDLEAYFAAQTKSKSWLKNKAPNYKIGKTIYLFKV